MSEFTDALRGSICGIWQSAPVRLIRIPPGSPLAPPGTGAFYDMMNSYCSGEPGFVPPQAESPFAGGQCPTQYDVTVTWTVTRNLTGQVFTAGGTGRYTGPIQNAGTQTIGFGIAGYINTADGNTAVTDIFDVREWSDFSWGVVNVVRVDGLPDNCGNPAPEFPGEPQPSDEDGIDITIPIVIAPDVTVNVPVVFSPEINNVRVPIFVDGNLIGEINLGGINFNVGSNGNGQPTNLQPVLDAIADTQGQIEIARSDLINGQNQTNNEVNENQQLIEGVIDSLEEVLQLLARIGIPESLALPGSQDLCETLSVVPNSIFNALFYISDQLRLLRQINCTENSVRTFLGRYQSTLDERVRYFSIPAGAKILEIEIENVEIPQRVGTYFVSAREGANGRYGFFNFAYDGGLKTYISGIPGQLWTRSTYAAVPTDKPVDQLRVLAEPDLIIAVYDSGIR